MAKKEEAAEVETQGLALDATGEGFSWNMDDTAEQSYPVLPKGTYEADIDSVEYKISKSSGNPMWEIRHLIVDPAWISKRVTVRSYVVFKTDQMGRVKTFLKRVAPDKATGVFNPKLMAESGDLIGRRHRVRLDIRESEEYGPSNEIKGVLASGGASGAGAGGFTM